MRPKETRIGVIAFDGAEELDFIGPFEVLSVARALGAPIAVALVTHQPRLSVTAAHGLRMRAERRLNLSAWDWLVVPGGGWVSRAPRGAWREARRGVLPAMLRRAHGRGTSIATVCTGALLAADLFKGRRAATHHLAMADLRRRGVRVVRDRVVDEGDLVSAGGVSSGIDLALHLVRRIAGASLARRTARQIEHPYRRVSPSPR